MKICEILESFDSTHSKTPVKSTSTDYSISSNIGGRKIEFFASRIGGSEANNTSVWSVSFSEGLNIYDKTGSGSQMQVFSFVIDCIKELVAKHNPFEIEFSSSKDDGNRSSLYRRLISKFTGYHLKDVQDGRFEELFTVTRNS